MRSLAIGGYRSFGAVQYFERLAKVNLFIGQNNSGKSNVLRFIQEVMSNGGKNDLKLDPLAFHLPTRPPMLLGASEPFKLIGGTPVVDASHHMVAGASPNNQQVVANLVAKVLHAKAKLDGLVDCWTLREVQSRNMVAHGWREAVLALGDRQVYQLWSMVTGQSQGSLDAHWIPELIKRFGLVIQPIKVDVIPAIRFVGAAGSSSDGFDGTGIIDRLAKLQNPDVHSRDGRDRFEAVTEFLREVTGQPDARIEIPYGRDTILVHMNGRVLPIESLGSGIHEVVILAAAATVLNGQVLCIEEPELHLNPILQKKLLRYLSANTSNQYFITTHSAALMDTPQTEVYHIRLVDGSSSAERVTTNMHKAEVCADLGYHPSDLLQANCIIWVEGPSDRLYVNWWLRSVEEELIEGIHYSLMFYGGRLAAHLSNAPDESEVTDFISLRRLNRRSVIMIDSDKDKARSRINSTKRRLQEEFDLGPGHAWITAGREIENYLPPDQLLAAIQEVNSSATPLSCFGPYDANLRLRRASGKEDQASKVEVARFITTNFKPNLELLDLRSRLKELYKFIEECNPQLLRRLQVRTKAATNVG